MVRIKGKDELDMRESRKADEASVRKILTNDSNGYSEIYDKYHYRLSNYLVRSMRRKNKTVTKEDAEDHASQAIINLFASIRKGDYDPQRAPLWPYLKATITNIAKNFWKKHYRRTIHFPSFRNMVNNGTAISLSISTDDQMQIDSLPSGLHNIYWGITESLRLKSLIRTLEADVNETYINEFLAGLSSTDFDLIKLHYFEGKTSEEISELRGMKAVTVRVRISRAIAKYREILKKNGETRLKLSL